MVCELLWQLGVQLELAQIAILTFHQMLIMSATDHQKMVISYQYLKHLPPDDESHVFNVDMTTYDFVLSLSLFQFRNSNIDCSTGQSLCLQTPVGNCANVRKILLLSKGDWTVDGCGCELSPPAVDIQLLGATALDDQLASIKLDIVYTGQTGKRTGLLRAATVMEGITCKWLEQMSCNQGWIGEQWAGVVVATERSLQRNSESLLPAPQDMKQVPQWNNLALL